MTQNLSIQNIHSDFLFIGFDFGATVDKHYNEPIFFSGIFSERFMWDHPSCLASSSKLNRYLLFDNPEQAQYAIQNRELFFDHH